MGKVNDIIKKGREIRVCAKERRGEGCSSEYMKVRISSKCTVVKMSIVYGLGGKQIGQWLKETWTHGRASNIQHIGSLCGCLL